MSFVKWNEMVETLATCGSDQSFAKRIRLWNAGRCLQHPNIHGPQGVVNSRREDGIAIMHHESVRVVARQEASELLRRPVGGEMLREIPMEDPSRGNLQHQEDVDEPERRGHADEEIAGEGPAGVVLKKRAPSLRG
jgi:hypothetical protein